MSTVKITDLPVISQLNTDTANTILVGVDLPTNTTGKITTKVLAEGLYANDVLKVGREDVTFTNTIAQFSDSGTPFLQINLQNTDGDSSGDYIVTADIGTNANNFIDVGMNGSTFSDPAYSAMKALDGYLYVAGSVSNSTNGNLVIGTASAGANVIIAPGGTTTANVVAKFTKHGLTLNNSSRLEFTDGSMQTVAAAPANYTQSAFDKANTVSIVANNAVANTDTITVANNLTIPGTTTFTGPSIFNGLITSNGGRISNGDTLFNGNVTANGVTTLNGPIILNGNTLFIGLSTHAGDLITNGNNVVNGTQTVNGNLIVMGNTLRTGNLTANGTVTWNGNTTTNGFAINNGNTQFNGNITTTGTLTIAGTIIPSMNTVSLGTIANPFQNIYTSNSNVVFSNSNITLTGTMAANTGQIYLGNTTISTGGSIRNVNMPSDGGVIYVGTSNTKTHSTTMFVNDAANMVNIANITIQGSNIYSTATSTDIIIGQTSATANVIINRLTNHTKDVNVTGNVTVSSALTANSVTVNDAGLIRYNVSGGNATVTQITNKSTAVTVNGRTGQITTTASNLAKGTGVTFTVNNNFVVSAQDVIIVNIASGATVNRYSLTVTNVNASGSFDITIGNFDNTGAGGAMTDTLVINFAVIRVN